MKKILAWVLLVVMLLGMLAGCKKEPEVTPTPTDPSVEQPTEQVEQQKGPTAEEAMEYLCAIYKNTEEPTPTPVNYDRYGIVRIAGVPFTVVWTVDVGEDLIKIVVNEDGTVTIDVNESCEVATPYTLTATITDEQGGSASHSWDMVLPAAVDMTEIVKTAYALGVGESLPYESTLRGEIVSINTVYSAEYKNITVTIAVEGVEDMPIMCYRLKGEGIEDLKVGNIITVTGTLKNYNGTIEFDAGCTLDAFEQGNAVEAPTDIGTILKAAYKLSDGQALPYPVTMTGTVTGIDSPYDPNYGNISVVIVADGYSNYPILAFRLKGVDVSKIAINDKITVTGIIKNYKGKIEFDAGCQMLDRVSGGGVAQGPSSDAEKILADANKLAQGEKLPYMATLTGEIVSVDQAYDPGYGNVTVTMKVNGQKIQCFRMKGSGVDQIRATDTITVTGIIENYFGKLEFGAGCTLDSWTMGSRVTPIDLGPLKTETAYVLKMDQNQLGKTLYFTGAKSGSYLATSENADNAVQLFVEQTEGKGVRFYFMDGETKTYLELESYTNKDGNLRARPALVTSPSVYWTYFKEAKVYTVELSGTKYFLGTYNTFDTISSSSTYYITDGNAANVGKTQFVAEFVLPGESGGEEGGETTGNVTLVDTPVVGTAYKFGMVQQNVTEPNLFYLTGGMASYYMATGTDVTAAIDVYLEETTGGYYLYTMVDGVKTYINMVVSSDGKHVNGAYEAAASTVYTYDAEAKTVIANVDGADYWFGTRSDNTYTTVGPCKTSFNGFYCQFYTASGNEGGETPDEPVVPEEPDVPVTGTTATLITELPKDGDVIVIVNGENAMTATATGKKLAGEAVTVTDGKLTLTDTMAQLTVAIDANGYYTFTVDGKYLTSGETGNSLSLTDAASDYSLWTVEAATDGTWYIKNVNAKYNGNTQSLEYYSGFTTYGHKNTAIYQMQLFAVASEPEAPTGGQLMTTAPVAGDVVVIVNGENAMTATANGKKLAGEAVTVTDGVLTLTETQAQLLVSIDANGYYTFTVDGKYLTSGETGNSLSLTDAASDYSLWTVEAATEDTWYIKNVNAKYNGNTQSLEYYSGFTTYGHKNTAIYQMQLYKVGAGSVTPPETPDEPDVPGVPDVPTEGPVVVDTPVAGTAYKFGMVQQNVTEPNLFYLIGGMAGHYMATGTDVTTAIDVYLEETEGGYYLYTMVDGVKTYINMVVSGKFVNGKYDTTASTVYTYDAEAKTIIADISGEPYWFGTRNDNTYTTVGPCKTSFNGFYCQFYTVSGNEGGETPDEPETPVVPEEPTEGGVVETPVAGTAYKFGMVQQNVTEPNLFYLIGGMAGHYMATGTDVTAAIDVYLEEAEGGYYLYTMVDGVKTYINMVVSGKYVNGKYETTASTVYTYDAEAKTIIADISGEPYWFGTRNDNTYTTVGPCKTSFNGFYMQFYTVSGNEGGETPDEPVVPEEPASVTYVMADYVVEGQLGGGEVIRELDENVSLTISSGWITDDCARVYKNANAVVASQNAMSSIVLNAGNKDSTFDVYVSDDGETWTMHQEDVAYTKAYSDVTIELPEGCKFVKIDAANAQVRFKTLTVTTAGNSADVVKTITIAAARDAATGTNVTVSGVVARITYANGFKPLGVILVDETSSIYVYDRNLAAQCAIGNTVTISASKTYWILETEQTNAAKFGYLGCNQLENAEVIEIDSTVSEFPKAWIEESTVKQILDTPFSEDVTTKIFKVTALVKEKPGNGFTNFYIYDLDGKTGTYSYSQCNGNDFDWLRAYDGKVCTVYVMALNAKSTASGCNWRFLPVLVEDNGFDPSTVNFAENAVKFYGVGQFLPSYTGDPAAELLTTADNELLGYTGAKLTYVSSDPSVVSIDENVLHCHKSGTVTVTVTGEHNGVTYSEDVTIEVKIQDDNAEYPTVAEAIAASIDETVTVKGIVGASLVNQDGFYLIDETGVIAVLADQATLETLEIGYEVVLEGTRYFKSKSGGNWGTTCIKDAKVLVNNYGSHAYSTASFDGTLTLAEFAALDVNVDYTTNVYTVTATVEVVETAYYTSIKLVDGDTSINLYSSSAAQYKWLQEYAGQTITMELAPCNWSSKKVYPACVLAVVHEDGSKTVNSLNFN